MKKILFFWMAFCLCGTALFAGPVSPGKALEIGKNLLSRPSTRAGEARVSICWNGEEPGSTQAPAFYVVARDGGGFVIIAGNDNARPILAVSETSEFRVEGMPAHVKWWMERMKDYVRSVSVQTPAAREQWARVIGTRASNVDAALVTEKFEAFLTPEWDQGNNDTNFFGQNVFNKYCPQDNGQLTITGCVATALGEILTTLSGIYGDAAMPSQGTGTVGGYSSSGGLAPAAYELSTVYDWAGLRTLTNIQAIKQTVQDGKTALLDNLGHLVADCGAIVQASYGVDGTSAGTRGSVTSGMAKHMYMSKSALSEVAAYYSPYRWKEMLKAELRQRPVFYSGQDPDHGGHAFVFDGFGKYGDEDVFHVNFGWAGFGNGYYYCDYLDSGNGNYSVDRDAIFGFFPDVTGQTKYVYRLQYYAVTYTDGTEGRGFSTQGEIASGQPVTFKFGGIINSGNTTYSYPVWIYREDKNGSQMEGNAILTGSLGDLSPNYYTGGWSLSRSFSNISFGDKLVGYYQKDDTGTKERIQASSDGSLVEEMPLTPAAFIQTKGTYDEGDRFQLKLKNYGSPYAGTIWTFTDPDGNTTTVNQSVGDYRFTQAGTYKIAAAIAPSPGADVVETVIAFVTVR